MNKTDVADFEFFFQHPEVSLLKRSPTEAERAAALRFYGYLPTMMIVERCPGGIHSIPMAHEVHVGPPEPLTQLPVDKVKSATRYALGHMVRANPIIPRAWPQNTPNATCKSTT